MKETLLQHYKDYPESQLQDFFKLLHQSEFGPGHLIADTNENFKRLVTEFENLTTTMTEPLFEILQPHLCRLHLRVLKETTLSIETLQRMFERSATQLCGHVAHYYKKIAALRELCADNQLPFNVKDVDQFKANIEVAPAKPIRHSEAYRQAYAPAYRVVEKKFCDVLPLFANIDKLMSKKKQVLVAIDGDCASGKTTLAGILKQIYDCNLVQMDHFFLRPEQRCDERLAMPGGNIDHERFKTQVLDKLKKQASFSYHPFNCMTGDFDPPIPLSAKRLTIIEGSYAHHPTLSADYDLKVFLSISEDVQLTRLLKRNGEVIFEKFKNLWIPMEKKYAEVFDIQKKSDLQFNDLDRL